MRDDDDLYDDYKDQMFDPDFFVEPAQKSEPAEEAERLATRSLPRI